MSSLASGASAATPAVTRYDPGAWTDCYACEVAKIDLASPANGSQVAGEWVWDLTSRSYYGGIRTHWSGTFSLENDNDGIDNLNLQGIEIRASRAPAEDALGRIGRDVGYERDDTLSGNYFIEDPTFGSPVGNVTHPVDIRATGQVYVQACLYQKRDGHGPTVLCDDASAITVTPPVSPTPPEAPSFARPPVMEHATLQPAKPYTSAVRASWIRELGEWQSHAQSVRLAVRSDRPIDRSQYRVQLRIPGSAIATGADFSNPVANMTFRRGTFQFNWTYANNTMSTISPGRYRWETRVCRKRLDVRLTEDEQCGRWFARTVTVQKPLGKPTAPTRPNRGGDPIPAHLDAWAYRLVGADGVTYRLCNPTAQSFQIIASTNPFNTWAPQDHEVGSVRHGGGCSTHSLRVDGRAQSIMVTAIGSGGDASSGWLVFP